MEIIKRGPLHLQRLGLVCEKVIAPFDWEYMFGEFEVPCEHRDTKQVTCEVFKITDNGYEKRLELVRTSVDQAAVVGSNLTRLPVRFARFQTNTTKPCVIVNGLLNELFNICEAGWRGQVSLIRRRPGADFKHRLLINWKGTKGEIRLERVRLPNSYCA